MAQKPHIVITARLPDGIERRLHELFSCQWIETNTEQALIAAVSQCDVLVPTITDRINHAVIAAAAKNRCRLIASYGVGVDHIDLTAAHKNRIIVSNTPDVHIQDTADMVIAMTLTLARRIGEGERRVRSRQWKGWTPLSMLGKSLSGSRFGIIGCGRVGQEVARKMAVFGVTLHYHNRRRLPSDIEQKLNLTFWPTLDQMLTHMDIVSVNCPHTPATYHLLSKRRLALMKPSALLVNISRGEVVAETALIAALSQNTLGGAALDVHERAPKVNPKLLSLENVVLLPHMASATHNVRVRMGERVLINIQMWNDGHTPPDRVLETQF